MAAACCLAGVSSHGSVEDNYDDSDSPPRVCQNCQAVLRGPYCARCGQHDVDYHRSFYYLTHDLLENLFHFEGKFFTRVARLLAEPGRLTREFNAGRRQSQLNPLRFYIFVTVLFFVGVHALNHGHLFDFDRKKADQLSADMARNVKTATANAGGLGALQTERVGELIGEEAAARRGRIDSATIKEIIERVRRETAAAAAIHLHTWAFLAFMVGNGYFKLAALGAAWLTTLFAWLLAGWMGWYVFRAFRVVYEQRRLKTAVKLALAGGSYLVALVGLTGVIIFGTVALLVMN